jgi:hypothetical protein
MIARTHRSLAGRLASALATGVLRTLIVILIMALPLLAFWVADLRAVAHQPQHDCAFGSIAVGRYRTLFDQAWKQPWSVWPTLSNGLFWPSDRGPLPPTAAVSARAENRLIGYIRDLAPAKASANEQLAAAHAVMRGIGA